jgi:hypothetical protein
MRLIVVTNKAGRVLGATHAPPEDAEIKWGISPLKGQYVREVPVPEHLYQHEPHEILKSVMKLKLPTGAKEFAAPAVSKKS